VRVRKATKLITTACTAAALLFLTGCKGEKSQDVKKDVKSERAALYDAAKAKAKESKGGGLPSLWKISDEDSDVYIFGTVHLLRPETQWQNATVTGAFDESDRFYMEADIMSPDVQRQMIQLMQDLGELPEGESLYDHMDVGDTYNFKRALENIEFDPKALDNLQPWNASLQIAQYQMLQSGYNPLSGVEIILIQKANKQGKTFGYFETVEDQMKVLSGGEFDDQMEDLLAMSETLTDGTAYLDLLVDEWADGDVAGLGALVANRDIMGSDFAYEGLLKDRNEKWIPQIIDILDEPGSSFVAVGAAHLAGPDSVVLMLESEGVTVEKVQ